MDDATKRSLDYIEAREKDRQSDFGEDVKYSAWFLLIGGGLVVCVIGLVWSIATW